MIKKLDGEVATRIAAGEVIERPASVAKELLENSLDADSHNITIYAEQGGKTSFVIEDDGAGIAFNELPLAVERYATSKISTLDDLENISTLGYRGEALASVAAVSRLEIRSRERGSDKGGLIRCEGGAITLHAENPCKQGTRIQVDDLFFNLPARRKFLKTGSAELRRIIQIVNDYALVRPDVTFRLFSDGRKILEHGCAGNIDEALKERWGEDAKKYCASRTSGRTTVRLWWNPIPDSRRVTATIFVNGRRIQDSAVRAAICGGEAAAYGEWLVVIEMPPEDVDVNIHPTKQEVRFRRSQEIFKLVYDAAQDVFARRFSVEHGVSFEPPTGKADFTLKGAPQPDVFDRTSSLFSSTPWRPAFPQESRVASSAAEAVFIPAERGAQAQSLVEKRYIGQTARGFLLFDFPEGLAVVDPHAAHERILFEDICEAFKDHIATQVLAVPLDIPSALLPEVKLNAEELLRLGFVSEDGRLTGVPALRGKGHTAPVEMLRSALRGLEMENDPAKRDREVWWRLARLACRDAVKLGRRMESEEAEELMRRLDLCSSPYTCPHGRPTVFILDDKKLEEWFER